MIRENESACLFLGHVFITNKLYATDVLLNWVSRFYQLLSSIQYEAISITASFLSCHIEVLQVQKLLYWALMHGYLLICQSYLCPRRCLTVYLCQTVQISKGQLLNWCKLSLLNSVKQHWFTPVENLDPILYYFQLYT